MRRVRWLTLLAGLMLAVPTLAQDPNKAGEPKPAASKITGVTVYQNTALVVREVTAPDAMGAQEVIVTPLPPSTMATSLYAEGSDGVRIMSTRYRTRAINEDNREEVRKLEGKIKDNNKKLQSLQSEHQVVGQNIALLGKLENFTSSTLGTLTDKGQLDSEKTIALVTFIRETRVKGAKEEVALKQQMDALQEDTAFTQRRLGEVAGGVSRTERDAVIFIEKTKAGPATIRLNYLVGNVTWRPQYKLRAGIKDKDPVVVEYLAAVAQQTGEDWNGVDIVLSTAQPLLNASPPDLRAMEIGVGGVGGVGGQGGFGGGQFGQAFNPDNNRAGQAVPPPAGPGSGAPQGGGMPMPTGTAYLKSLEDQSKSSRAQAQNSLNIKDISNGNKFANEAAALEQYRDLLATKEDLSKLSSAVELDGPSVNYHLKAKLTLPSRNDEQVIEISKLDMTPKFYYKAVPLLTSNVYRIADLINATEMILLPGDATMYLGMDFVGQTKMPLVAIGKPFTIGFGADPQLSVSRKLMDKTRSVQGGNQVLNFKYRILVNSYKTTPVDVQVVDRMPHAEASQQIAVMLVKGELDLSKDPLYLRDERTKNLLRWDVKADPKQNGEKALSIDYEYKMEFEKSINIGAVSAK